MPHKNAKRLNVAGTGGKIMGENEAQFTGKAMKQI